MFPECLMKTSVLRKRTQRFFFIICIFTSHANYLVNIQCRLYFPRIDRTTPIPYFLLQCNLDMLSYHCWGLCPLPLNLILGKQLWLTQLIKYSRNDYVTSEAIIKMPLHPVRIPYINSQNVYLERLKLWKSSKISRVWFNYPFFPNNTISCEDISTGWLVFLL